MNLRMISKVDGGTGLIKTHYAIHIQVKVVEFDLIGVRTCHVNRNDHIIAVLILNFRFLLLDNCAD